MKPVERASLEEVEDFVERLIEDGAGKMGDREMGKAFALGYLKVIVQNYMPKSDLDYYAQARKEAAEGEL